MSRVLASLCWLAIVLADPAWSAEPVADPAWPRDVRLWHEIRQPPGANGADAVMPPAAANAVPRQWRVAMEGDCPCADLMAGEPVEAGERPDFPLQGGPFRRVAAIARVDDGWLVGFNEGRLGGAIHWFSPDGSRQYEVSWHPVLQFVTLPSGLHAVEGHVRRVTRGSLIHLVRAGPDASWRAERVAPLRAVPVAVAQRRDKALLVVVTNGVFRIDTDYTVTRVFPGPDPPVGGWLMGDYAMSAVLSGDEQTLYIGMRQFVGALDLATNRLRLLVPSPAFLDRPPGEEAGEQRGIGE